VTDTEIKTIIQQELPDLIAQDPLIRDFILRTVSNYYAGKQETESLKICNKIYIYHYNPERANRKTTKKALLCLW
jgi:hypothetical protein